METEKNICIVIPCYNEEKKLRLQLDEFNTFIKEYPSVSLCFVNDGSADKTLEIIEKIKFKNEKSVDIVSYTKNVGKAEAVRRGMHWCNRRYDHSYIAYLDADLSTPLQECVRLRKYLNEKLEFCFASRIMRIGSIIERNFYRFLIGRCIATIISNILELKAAYFVKLWLDLYRIRKTYKRKGSHVKFQKFQSPKT